MTGQVNQSGQDGRLLRTLFGDIIAAGIMKTKPEECLVTPRKKAGSEDTILSESLRLVNQRHPPTEPEGAWRGARAVKSRETQFSLSSQPSLRRYHRWNALDQTQKGPKLILTQIRSVTATITMTASSSFHVQRYHLFRGMPTRPVTISSVVEVG